MLQCDGASRLLWEDARTPAPLWRNHAQIVAPAQQRSGNRMAAACGRGAPANRNASL